MSREGRDLELGTLWHRRGDSDIKAQLLVAIGNVSVDEGVLYYKQETRNLYLR